MADAAADAANGKAGDLRGGAAPATPGRGLRPLHPVTCGPAAAAYAAAAGPQAFMRSVGSARGEGEGKEE
jgi:hypothetical protein